MGCHTWYKIPAKITKEQIIEFAKKEIEKEWYSEDYRKMYQYAIDNDLCDVCCDLAMCNAAAHYHPSEGWKLYLNLDFGNNPRVGGYPDRIIHSYQEMCEFVKEGYTDEDGKHHIFYNCNSMITDNATLEDAMETPRRFFEQYPDGIVTFG